MTEVNNTISSTIPTPLMVSASNLNQNQKFILKNSEIVKALGQVSKETIIQCLKSTNHLYKLVVDDSLNKIPKQKLLHIIHECICFSGIDDFIASQSFYTQKKIIDILSNQINQSNQNQSNNQNNNTNNQNNEEITVIKSLYINHPYYLKKNQETLEEQQQTMDDDDEDAKSMLTLVSEISQTNDQLSFFQAISSMIKNKGVGYLLEKSDLETKKEYSHALCIQQYVNETNINEKIKDEILLRGTELYLRNLKAPIVKSIAESLKINKNASKELIIDKLMEVLFNFDQLNSSSPLIDNNDHNLIQSPPTTPVHHQDNHITSKNDISSLYTPPKSSPRSISIVTPTSSSKPKPPPKISAKPKAISTLDNSLTPTTSKRKKKPNQKYLYSDDEDDENDYNQDQLEVEEQDQHENNNNNNITKPTPPTHSKTIIKIDKKKNRFTILQESDKYSDTSQDELGDEEDEQDEEMIEEEGDEGEEGEEEEQNDESLNDQDYKPLNPFSLIQKGISKQQLHTLFKAPDLKYYCKLNSIRAVGNKTQVMKRILLFLDRSQDSNLTGTTVAKRKRRKKTR